jgi:alkanesulfonate monooxygenase SsuD/methylene tetrahydromethanopterin reductase-like flavin-dependent oxidoreductase (luciferase family)
MRPGFLASTTRPCGATPRLPEVAQTAERGKFDFFFLAEGLRLREQDGKIYDLDVMGRPDTFTVLAAAPRPCPEAGGGRRG